MTRLESWVASANSATCPFPLNNLPYGVFSIGGDAPRCGVAIGDKILDVTTLEKIGIITLRDAPVLDRACWNPFMALGSGAWGDFRAKLTALLAQGSSEQTRLTPHLYSQAQATLLMPFDVAEYTDFYAGKQHAQNLGQILRGSDQLPENWLHIPIGYNGRASSVVVSGTPITRPNGQLKSPNSATPHFGPSQKLDIELELGAIVGTATPVGAPVTLAQASEMIFGYVLLNDWSARDIQGWEYQPLGPFQGKAFGTSISPWIVPALALAPFRAPAPERAEPLLPYLTGNDAVLDIELEVLMQPRGATSPTCLSKTNAKHLYYSAAQQLCHHAIGGCGMNTGDLLGSGTISGPDKSQFGSLVELSWNGQTPFPLATGETRSFIEDGDTLTLRGAAVNAEFQIGFGDCTGTILPAPKL